MAPKLKKAISYIVPPIITVGLCYVLYSDLDLGEIAAAVGDCNFLYVAIFLSCNTFAMIFRGLRWRLQLRAIGVDPGVGVMTRSIFGTYAVNLVFPRLGEVWRCGYIARVGSAPFSSVFGTMVADRLSDTLAVGLICVPTFILSSSALVRFLSQAKGGADVVAGLTSWPVVVAALLVVVLAVWLWKGRDKFAARVREFLVKTWRGFAVIFRMPRRGLWLLLTIGIWGSYILSMGFSMASFPPTAALISSAGLGSVMLTFVFGSLAMAIPSNGGIGPWQLAVMLSLSGLYGLPESQALVFATINLGATTLLSIALGLYSFARIAIKGK